MRKLPTPWSIVWTDNVCYRIVTIAPLFFLFALAVKLTGTMPGGRGRPDRPVDPEFASFLLACTGAMQICLGSIVALRVARVRGLFESGVEVEGTVAKVSRFRGGATLKLEYERAGTTHRVRSSFQNWRRTPTFTAGDRVPLLVDRESPKRGVPIALYATDDGGAPASKPASTEAQTGTAALPKQVGLRLGSGRSQPAGRGAERERDRAA